MKKVIRASIDQNNFDKIKDATSNSEIKDGYRENIAYGYVAKKTNGQLSINKPRPYDDADYYWALYDENKEGWKIIFKGKTVDIMLDSDIEDIDEVAEMLAMVNGPIQPRMMHN